MSDASETPYVVAAFTFLIGLVGYNSRRKDAQQDQHLELVDRRLGDLESTFVSKDTLNYELDKNMATVSKQLDELKAGHLLINSTLLALIKESRK